MGTIKTDRQTKWSCRVSELCAKMFFRFVLRFQIFFSGLLRNLRGFQHCRCRSRHVHRPSPRIWIRKLLVNKLQTVCKQTTNKQTNKTLKLLNYCKSLFCVIKKTLKANWYLLLKQICSKNLPHKQTNKQKIRN